MRDSQAYDVTIVGAGVTGCAIAREMSKYRLRVLVLEKAEDVGSEASKACTGQALAAKTSANQDSLSRRTSRTIVAGKIGAQLEAAAAAAFERTCKELDVPFRRHGSLMVVFDQYGVNILTAIYEEGRRARPELEMLGRDRLIELEPSLSHEVLAGLHNPNLAVFSPFELTLGYAESAIINGVEFRTGAEVIDIRCDDGHISSVVTGKGSIRTKYVVACAGMFNDRIARMVGIDDFDIRPRKGQYIVMDQNLPYKVSKSICMPPIPYGAIQNASGAFYSGFYVCPTVYGNMLLGPTAEDQMDKEDKSTTADMLELVWSTCKALVPALRREDVIGQFAGLRPVRYPDAVSIFASQCVKGFVGVTGLRSNGFGISPALGPYVAALVAQDGFVLKPKREWVPSRKRPVRFRDLDAEERRRIILNSPDYGEIVCRCESVTRAEVLQAIHGALPALSLDAVKRRVQAGMGRCQGGYCGPRLARILAEELQVSMSCITKRGHGSCLVSRPLKQPKHER